MCFVYDAATTTTTSLLHNFTLIINYFHRVFNPTDFLLKRNKYTLNEQGKRGNTQLQRIKFFYLEVIAIYFLLLLLFR